MNPTLIVCPISFSSGEERAMAHALSLARWHDAVLHLLHVRPGGRRLKAADTDTTHDLLHKRLVASIENLNVETGAVAPVVLEGDPVAAVVEYARRKSAELIVVGQNGPRGTLYWSSGAYATALARAADCPTMVVPNGTTRKEMHDPFRNIVCAVDFSFASLRAMRHALTMAQQSAGRITLLHVLEGFPYEAIYSGTRAVRVLDEYTARVERTNRKLQSFVPREALDWCDVETHTVSGIADEAIPKVALERQADLIVMGLPRRGRLAQIAMGSTAKGVVRRAPCLVLAVPDRSGVPGRLLEATVNHADDALAPGAPLISGRVRGAGAPNEGNTHDERIV